MSVELDHTVVLTWDKEESSVFLAHILGVEAGAQTGPFIPVEVANDVTLDYLDSDDFRSQHCAFAVSDAEFDAIFERVTAAAVAYYADPGHRGVGEINHRFGGRGFYLDDPNGHAMEVLTKPRTRVQKAAVGDTQTWQRVEEDQEIFTGDIIDDATDPDAEMTVGFAPSVRARRWTHRFRMTRS